MKPQIPVDIAKQLKRPGVTWKQVARELKKMGYPPEPYNTFLGESVNAAVRRAK